MRRIHISLEKQTRLRIENQRRRWVKKTNIFVAGGTQNVFKFISGNFFHSTFKLTGKCSQSCKPFLSWLQDFSATSKGFIRLGRVAMPGSTTTSPTSLPFVSSSEFLYFFPRKSYGLQLCGDPLSLFCFAIW